MQREQQRFQKFWYHKIFFFPVSCVWTLEEFFFCLTGGLFNSHLWAVVCFFLCLDCVEHIFYLFCAYPQKQQLFSGNTLVPCRRTTALAHPNHHTVQKYQFSGKSLADDSCSLYSKHIVISDLKHQVYFFSCFLKRFVGAVNSHLISRKFKCHLKDLSFMWLPHVLSRLRSKMISEKCWNKCFKKR